MPVFGYHARQSRRIATFVLVLFGIFALALLRVLLTGGGPGSFALLWLAGLGWVAYAYLGRFGCSIEVDGTRVTWRSLLRRREVDVLELTGNGSAWGQFAQLDVRGGPPLVVMAEGLGWMQFLESLNAVHPARPFEAGASDLRRERWRMGGGRSGYYERGR